MTIFQKKNIPNFLSVFRILLLPLYLYLFFYNFPNTVFLSALVLILCAATDVLDGYLARKNNWISNTGKLLDPLADKLATLCALFALTIKDLFPLWICLLILTKELLMVLFSTVLLRKEHLVVSSVWYGKATTFIFYIVVLLLHFFPAMPSLFKWILWGILAFSMVAAAILYLTVYLPNLKNQPQPKD